VLLLGTDGSAKSFLVVFALFSRSLLVIQLLETPFVLRLTVLYDKQMAEFQTLWNAILCVLLVHILTLWRAKCLHVQQ
jgi:hypothetical protein